MVTFATIPLRSASQGVDHLLGELEEAWAALSAIRQKLLDASREVRQRDDSPNNFIHTQEHYEHASRLLLIEPTEQFARLRPIRRSLEAMQEFHRDNPEAPLRARARIDARFQLLLIQAALDLCEPWRIHRSGGHEPEWHIWEKRFDTQSQRASDLLAAYREWAGKTAGRKSAPMDRARQQSVELWWRRQTAATAVHGNAVDQIVRLIDDQHAAEERHDAAEESGNQQRAAKFGIGVDVLPAQSSSCHGHDSQSTSRKSCLVCSYEALNVWSVRAHSMSTDFGIFTFRLTDL